MEIINKCFATSCFPTKLKCSKFKPDYKQKVNIDIMSNYRTLNIVSPLSKIVVASINTRLTPTSYRNITFQKGKSTAQAAAKLRYEIHLKMRKSS